LRAIQDENNRSHQKEGKHDQEQSSAAPQWLADVGHVACSVDSVRIVGHDHGRPSLAIQSLEQLEHTRFIVRVQLARGLVRKQYRRPVGYRARHGDSLPPAT
jgi:hypothetical protein